MTNLIIDGNYMAFATYSIFSNYGKIKAPLKKESDQVAFIHDLANKLVQTINQMPRGGRVVFCVDSRSWRKEFMDKYKESREDEDGNKSIMDNETKQVFYALIGELGELLQKVGIIYSKVQGAEGDDLIFKWAKYFNDLGENCILITADRDLTQVVRGPEEPWNIVWTNKSNNNKLYASPGWLDRICDGDEEMATIFDFNITTDKTSLLSIIRDHRPEINAVNTADYVLRKILVGDDGDDVPSCWHVKKDEKTVRVTDKKAEKIMNILCEIRPADRWLSVLLEATGNEALSDNTQGRLDEMSGVILRIMDDVDDKRLREMVSNNLIRNAKLVWLIEQMLPFNINQMINENINKGMLIGDNKRVTKALVLDGSRFSKQMQRSSMDPFDLFGLPE